MENKNNISVCFTPRQFDDYSNEQSIVVVVDLLRATSVISTAFACGIKEVIPVTTIDEALSYKDKDNYIIAAERNTKLVEGFEFGNSPYHYLDANINNKTLVITTTNGTKAIHIAKNHTVITSSYINIDATVDFLKRKSQDVIIFCSGWKNLFNLEDVLFAGSITKLLLKSNQFQSNCDSLLASQSLLKSTKGDLFGFLKKSSYRKRNHTLELLRDTKFCLTPKLKSDIIPLFVNGRLVKAP